MINRPAIVMSSFALLLWLPAAALGDTLDQSTPSSWTPSNYLYVGTDMLGKQHAVGQTFTAGLDGYLNRVRVYLENDPTSPATGPILVSIQPVTADGLPSGRQVADGTIEICSSTIVENCVAPAGSPGWIDVHLSPLIVTPGTRYAIALRATGGGHVRWYDFIGPSAYTGGCMAGNDGSGWWAGTYDDMAFQTYVSTPVLDQSQTSGYGYNYLQHNARLFDTWWTEQSMGQIFTAGVRGYLHRVRVMLENHSATAPIAVSIQTVAGGYYNTVIPSGIEIGSGTIPADRIPAEGSPGWVDVAINDPFVIPGSRYAIVLSMTGDGWMKWRDEYNSPYQGGDEAIWHPDSWYSTETAYTPGPHDATFETYVLPPITRSPGPLPRTITPCAGGVCPETSGGLTPADFTDGITTHFLFKERPNGTVQGILDFTDTLSDDAPLKGCTTESAACRLTVTTFACSGPHEMTVAGGFLHMGDTYADSYKLIVSGVKDGSGTLTLSVPGLTYTFSRDRLVDVTCPAVATR